MRNGFKFKLTFLGCNYADNKYLKWNDIKEGKILHKKIEETSKI